MCSADQALPQAVIEPVAEDHVSATHHMFMPEVLTNFFF